MRLARNVGANDCDDNSDPDNLRSVEAIAGPDGLQSAANSDRDRSEGPAINEGLDITSVATLQRAVIEREPEKSVEDGAAGFESSTEDCAGDAATIDSAVDGLADAGAGAAEVNGLQVQDDSVDEAMGETDVADIEASVDKDVETDMAGHDGAMNPDSKYSGDPSVAGPSDREQLKGEASDIHRHTDEAAGDEQKSRSLVSVDAVQKTPSTEEHSYADEVTVKGEEIVPSGPDSQNSAFVDSNSDPLESLHNLTEAEALLRVKEVRRAAELAEADSIRAWAQALEAEKSLADQIEVGASTEAINELSSRVESLRAEAAGLSDKAERARHSANLTEDYADSLQQERLKAEAERILTTVHRQEAEDAEQRAKVEREQSAARKLRQAQEEEAARKAAIQAAAHKDAMLRRAARRRQEAAAAAQSKAVDERAEVARKTLKLDLSSLGICDIPLYVYSDPLLRHIRILWLNQNEFEALPSEIARLQDLTQLRVFQNQLRYLPPEIGDLGKLQILWLQDNLLDTLPPEIEKLTSLTLLSLKGNPLKVLPVELSRLKRIREMELDTNFLTFPPPAISREGTRQVQEFLRRADRAWVNNRLDLRNMSLDCLPLDIIDLFPRVEHLLLTENPIPNIPFEFSAMTQLSDLQFDAETMRSPSMKIWGLGLPRAFAFMRKFLACRDVPSVDLRGWGLDEIPSEVFAPELGPHVTVLDFSENDLREVPDAISCLQSITRLNLDNNCINNIPESIGLLSSLTLLSCVNNVLSVFPDCMGTMHSLSELYLDSNVITRIPSTILQLKKLKRLSMSSNRISVLPPEMPKVISLRHLSVEDNLIQRLPLEFGEFTSLTRLDIGRNQIWSPPPDILKQGLKVWFSYLSRLLAPLNAKSSFGTTQVSKGRLDLSRFGLSACPPEISRYPMQFISLAEVNMDCNRLSTLPKDLGKLTNLTVISLAKNLFRACPSVLGRLYNLTDINLERNLLTYLPMEIGSLTALKRLRVEGNNLSHPPMEIVKLGIAPILRFLKVFSQGTGSGEVAMSGCNLKAVPLAVADIENLTRLDLSHNAIGRIPSELLHNTMIKYLDLSYNVISELEPEISGLVNLRTLILTGNKIEVMIDSIFSLTNLKVLVMNRNLLDDIPPQIGVMTWLKELKLSNNRIEDVPLEIGRLVSLQRLNLAYNQITAIPVTIGNLTSLRDMSLVGNELQFLPPILGVMSGLLYVHFLDNDLEQHPPEVIKSAKEQLSKNKTWHNGQTQVSPLALWLSRMRAARITKALDASQFNLVHVPAEVLKLTTLQLLLLDLHQNEIESLPPSISRLSTLTHLDLSQNTLKSIPSIIGTMSNLTVLYLNENKLTRLPIEIGHLPRSNLKRLTINNNQLETPPKEMLTLPTSEILRYYSTSEIAILTGELDWSWCKKLLNMGSICLEVLHWERLRILHLDNNEIASIDVEMCLTMEKLEVLELRKNRLMRLPEQLCAHTSLRVLALSSNKISKLPVTLCGMPALTELEILGMNVAFPCKEITQYGTENILAYLQSIQQAYTDQICILSHFDLSEIPCEVLEMKYVEILELDYMRIDSLPSTLANMTVLKRLTFSYNRIVELPVFLSILSNLTELEFEGNRIQRLPPEHGFLTRLHHLRLSKNPIETPPQEVLYTLEASLHDKRHGSRPVSRGVTPGQGRAITAQSGRSSAVHLMSPITVLRFLRALFNARHSALLDLSDFRLGTWPNEVQLTPDIVELVLDSNSIRFIGQDIQNLCCLERFSICRNRLKSIVPALGQVTTLKLLDVSHNQIEDLSPAIGSLIHLEVLLATDNSLVLLPTALFQCTCLQTLHLDRNSITELPPEFGSLSKLEDLTYDENPVVIPPEEIRFQGLKGLLRFYNQIVAAAPSCNLKGMECEIAGFDLELDDFSLENLPEVVFRGMTRPGGSWDDPPNRFRRDRWAFGMTHLRSLSLNRNKMSTLPDLLSRCTAIKRLSVAHNVLKCLPSTFTALKSLQFLDLRNNSLESLHESMSRLEELRELLLDENRLSALPDGLGNLSELHTLQVNKNRLINLPVDLCETKSIRILGVNDNPLRMPPNEIVSRGLRHIMDWLGRLLRCSKTQVLDLRSLELSSVDYNILPIANVRRIMLSNNKLTTMSAPSEPHNRGRVREDKSAPRDNGNEKLQNLEYLNADNNLMTEIPASIQTLTSLTELSLKNNCISLIPVSISALTNLKKLFLSNNALTSLPVEISLLRSSLRKLDLEGNVLTMPPEKICVSGVPFIMKYLSDLLTSKSTLSLDVVGLKLDIVPHEVVELTSLERLSLDENQICEIPIGLCRMKNLTHLSMSRNRLSVIPRELFESLLELQLLHLDSNQISVLPVQIGRLTKLEELHVQLNSILILPLEVGNLTLLRNLILDVSEMVSPTPEICAHGTKSIVYYLRCISVGQETGAVDLRSQGLTAFPVEIFAISSLTSLHLDDNHLASLPPSLERLTDLTELTLTRLRLTSLPYVLGACTGLTSLRIDASRRFRNPPYEVVMQGTAAVLSYLQRMYRCSRETGYINLSSLGLEVIPTELLGLQSLTHLQCRDNALQHLPREIGGMHAVEVIHMHRNRLVSLPPEVGRLGALVVLRLPSNRLCTLPAELGACHALRKLSLQDNLLVTTPPAVLSGLSDLESLNVGRNQIVLVPDAVGEMLGLRKLRADQNQLRGLPSALGRCTRLTLLSLTCNLLAGLPDSLGSCTDLTALHLSSNRFRLLPRCIDGLVGLRWLWAANNELVGLPSSLAGLPHLFELQVNGCADLRYPPPDVVGEGLDAVRAYLLCNMQYEVAEGRPNLAAEEAAVAEAKARGDAEAAELAAAVIKPLRRLAEEAAEGAAGAARTAAELRYAADSLHAKALMGNGDGGVDDGGGGDEGSLDLAASEFRRAAEAELAASRREEAEEAALAAEAEVVRLQAVAAAAAARSAEAVLVFTALSEIAAESEREAEALRLRAGGGAVGGDRKTVELIDSGPG